jgi:hypothetical protein
MDIDARTLGNTLINEIISALGLPKTRPIYQLFWLLFHKVTDRMGEIGVTFDYLVAEEGFSKAAAWVLTQFCSHVTARHNEPSPAEGPLLVVSNHPGTYDSLVVTSQVGRDDMRFIAGDIPFLEHLPHACRNFIFIEPRDAYNRMAAARDAIRHLQRGQAIFLFGSGHIDPDPAVYPRAAEHIEAWYTSVEVFLRHVPQTRLLLALVSHVVAPEWARHPITWLRKQGIDKRRLAEFGQVITQLLSPGKLKLTPFVSFASPVTVQELRAESDSEQLLPAIIRREKALLAEHLAWVGRNYSDRLGERG